MNLKTKLKSFILCMMLIVAMALCTVGCGNNETPEQEPEATPTAQLTEEPDSSTETPEATKAPETDATVLGEGSIQFNFSVIDKDGNETKFEIHTDKETVGAALLELELIAGDESEFGLYVKTVNGITADYDTDGTYWAFYVNGEYATSGVDTTAVTEGDSYSFKVEK